MKRDALAAAKERLILAHRNYRGLIHRLTPSQAKEAEERIATIERHVAGLEREVTADDIIRGARRR